MHTFYVPPSQIRIDIATITDSEHHHLHNVLRITPGETVQIIDGQGNVYTAEVRNISTKNASSETRILSHEFHASVLPLMTLFQGLPKNDKMEMILQKTTEIGVTQIVPLRTEHALQKPSQNRYERWHRVVIAATKQCKRAWLPELCEPQTFETSLAQPEKFSRCLILNPQTEQELLPTQHIKAVLRETPQATAIAFFVGPEGGFSNQEVATAVENGCIPVTLGTNILRTETAAIVAVAVAAYEYQL